LYVCVCLLQQKENSNTKKAQLSGQKRSAFDVLEEDRGQSTSTDSAPKRRKTAVPTGPTHTIVCISAAAIHLCVCLYLADGIEEKQDEVEVVRPSVHERDFRTDLLDQYKTYPMYSKLFAMDFPANPRFGPP